MSAKIETDPYDWMSCVRVTKTQQRYLLFPAALDVSVGNLYTLVNNAGQFLTSPPGPITLHVAPLHQGEPFTISSPVDFPYLRSDLRKVLVALTESDPNWYTRAIFVYPVSEDRAAMMHRKLVLD